ncbi:uncharacterized protein K452DRAFT_308730 [Aplosporella prunicola CBS 121167]|uniref:separase n=1 Tax=Aplosporella prunicola CBS 121167 TaxID=1176127 RepID=A0A6A6BEE3_9PEZI|nr:uncharacterized protein K452DRAFT_308730 [Aplosporella prunicola CBS 121167]KAF2141644.1 hypothetical protein K452DRAFT_308730 [Aplosporella prunicola CBS 121167]
MTTTTVKPSRPDLDAIKSQLSAPTCAPATVTALQQLLGAAGKPTAANDKENDKPKTGRTAAATSTTKTKTATKARTKSKATSAVEVVEDVNHALLPREKFTLATTVVNSSLKALSDALKPQPKSHARVASTVSKQPEHSTTNSASQSRPAPSRTVSQLSNVSTKPLQRRSSSLSITKSGVPSGITSLAECARLAFAYLRTPEAWKAAGKDLPPLQVENGMLSLVGKMLGHGLDALAAKELRLLKRRLEIYMDTKNGDSGTLAKVAGGNKATESAAEKDTMAGLLHFSGIDLQSSALHLVLNHQIYVLRIIANSKRASTIEAANCFLQTPTPSSPVNILLHLSERPGYKDKAARQLESVAQVLLSLCPSISTSEDSVACNPKFHATPEIIFQLQSLAFEARSKWWKLSGHEGDPAKELLEPFLKCLAAFARRSTAEPSEKYAMAVGWYRALEEFVRLWPTTKRAPCSSNVESNIHRVLSSLAQSATLGDEALQWMQNKASSTDNSRVSGAASATSQVRIAALHLDNTPAGKDEEKLTVSLDNALQSLAGNLSGDSADLDTLLAEVSGLRRAATRAFLDASNSSSDQVERENDIQDKCVLVIAACTHFLARYIGTSPGEDSDPKASLRHGERLAIASRVIKGFIDSAMACCRSLIISNKINWEFLDGLLQDCCYSLRQLEPYYKGDARSFQQAKAGLQHPFVKISGLYWLYYSQLKKLGTKGESLLRPLRRSIESLADRSEEEKIAGLYATKVEKMAEMFQATGTWESAAETYMDVLRTHINDGKLPGAAERASTSSLTQIRQDNADLVTLSKTLASFHNVLLRDSHEKSGQSLFYDDEALPHSERSLLLELQLDIFLVTATKLRLRDAAFERGLENLVMLLFQLYGASDYPLRRQRVATNVLRLAVELKGQMLFPDTLVAEAIDCTVEVETSLGLDAGLSNYQEYYAASHKMGVAFLEAIPSADKLQSALASWQRILNATDSWAALLMRIDSFDNWIWQLQMTSDFFGMQGLDFLRVPTLSTTAKALELQKPLKVDLLVRTVTSLGLQYLHLGYSGKAGVAFAKVQNLLGEDDVSTEADLQWHLAYAEYMLVINNHQKCGETLTAAHNIAANDSQILAMARSSSLGTRIRYSKILSDASYVYALYSVQAGYPHEALSHAKNCASLNRMIWTALENRDRKRAENGGAGSGAVQPTPVIMTITHDALTGASLWPHVPSIFRGLSLIARLYAHQGMVQEANFYLDQASKVSEAVKAGAFVVHNVNEVVRYHLQGERLEQASEALSLADPYVKQLHNSPELARYHAIRGQLEQELNEQDDACQWFDQAQSVISGLIDPVFIQQMDKVNREEEELSNKMSQVKLEDSTSRTRKAPAKKAATAKKSTAKPATNSTARKTAGAKSSLTGSTSATECPPLESIQGDILCYKANLLLSKEKLSEAMELITQAEGLKLAQNSVIQHQSTRFRGLMSEAMREIAADFTFNALPESTISFPSLSRGDRRQSEQSQARPSYLSVEQSTPTVPPPARKAGRGRKAAKEDFAAILQKARDCIAEVQNQVMHTSSTSVVRRVCSMLNEVTILLSATSGKAAKGSLHPLYAAYLTELPKAAASQLEQLAILIDQQPNRDQLLQWPALPEDNQKIAHLTPIDFQTEYVNIIPSNWAAVSLSLNEARDELYITRYIAHQSPFILRLPLSRHNARDMDEEIFGFEEGKSELKEIIDLSTFGISKPLDLTQKGAKTGWWAEREALDSRLGDLLVNIESIWLGGFRGIFAEKKGDKALLARFQTSFQNILDRHLPSRQGKSKQVKVPQLDSRILELFVGLGNPDDGDADLDEPLMDLVYFVVDILQFNGEKNAYDEIDFDSIIIEMLDALRAYHNAVDPASTKPQHTILILDKYLHSFPWESLPSLQSLSISRLPSMSALRERLIAARQSAHSPPNDDEEDLEGREGGHYIPRSSLRGTSILNPAGDLTHSQEFISPHLESMAGTWDNKVNLTPEEKYLEAALANNDVFLYFGHGSGSQYIRGRTVKKLYRQTHGPSSSDQTSTSTTSSSSAAAAAADSSEPSTPPPRNLATSLLFGCSSAHITENGAFEPSGMLYSYITAGVPAVLGMLWDVTDRDCDKFAVKTLQTWGLFSGSSSPSTSSSSLDNDNSANAAAAGSSKDRKGRSRTPARNRSASGKARARSVVSASRGRSAAGRAGSASGPVSLDEAVARSRDACYLRYLNGAAAVVYGIPVFLE